MDFFEYANLAQMFLDYGDNVWIAYLVGGLCFAVVFIFQAVALYTIAGREGYPNRWMAFVPFFNTYYIGVCAKKNRCFRLNTEMVSIVLASLEFVLVILNIISYVSVELLLANNCFTYSTEVMYGIEVSRPELITNLPIRLGWAGWCYQYLSYIVTPVNLIFLFIKVMVLSCFFQTYAARRYFLFTITSVLFPIQGILFFVVRNNRGMNYGEYIRRQQEIQYRIYSQYRQNYEPPRDDYNNPPYNNPPQPPQSPQDNNQGASDPFEGLGEDKDNSDPFDEFKN